MAFSKNFIDNIRAAANIVEIVGEVVELKAYNGDRYKGLCPFHGETSPSFTVDNGLFYCFGCGEGGDAIRFIQKHQSVSFGDAVRCLADRYAMVDDGVPGTYEYKPRRTFPIKPIPMPTTPIAPFVAQFDPVAAQLITESRGYFLHDDLLPYLGVIPHAWVDELAKLIKENP